MAKKSQTSPEPVPIIPKGFVKREEGQLLKPASGWYSLWLVLQTYRPKVLAEAIEQHGLFVFDRFDRQIPATNGPNIDSDSLNWALDLLAEVAAVERDPAPTTLWDSDRWEIEQHPLERFGWPEEKLPDLEAIKNAAGNQQSKVIPWTQRSKQEFEEELKAIGSKTKAAEIHGVSRQRYERVYDKVVGKPQRQPKANSAPGVFSWPHLGAKK
jgi:hypothetical protein